MNTSKLLVEGIRERIRVIRIEKGYSQDYMADMLKISQNAYHKLEASEYQIKRFFRIYNNKEYTKNDWKAEINWLGKYEN